MLANGTQAAKRLEANNIAFLTSDRTPTDDDVLEGVKNLVRHHRRLAWSGPRGRHPLLRRCVEVRNVKNTKDITQSAA